MKHLFILLITTSTLANPVDMKQFRSFSDLERGELTGTGLQDDGRIVMMPAFTRLADLNESYIWDACELNGTLYVAAGEKGKIYRVPAAGGAATLLTHVEEGTIYAIAPFNGKLIAGVSPSGKLLEVDPADGATKEAVSLEAEYVWRLVPSGGYLYIATGLPGSVLRVDRNMILQKVGTGLDTHVEALLADGDRILAGTHPRGYIMELGYGKDPYLLTDTPYDEVKDLAMLNGNLYAACFNGKPENNQNHNKVKPARNVTSPEELRGGIVVINHDNIPETRRDFSTMAPYAAWTAGDHVLIGTGHSGKILQLGNRNMTIAGEVDCGQVVRFFQSGNTTLFCTANPGRIYRMGSEFSLDGTYTSVPFVADHPVNWGRVYMDAETPRGSRVEFQVRNGNSASPDTTWSPWQMVKDGSAPTLKPSTGIQWRVRLISQDPAVSPSVSGFTIYYRSVNLPPRIETVRPLPPGVWVGEDAEADSKLYQPVQSKAALESVKAPDSSLKVGYKAGMQSIQVDVKDPNDDRLRYRYAVVDVSGRQTVLEENGKFPIYSFHAARLPEGRYRCRITVSDDRENRPRSFSDTGDSEWFVIDRTGPDISSEERRGKQISFSVSDGASLIEYVEFSTDGGETWDPVWPTDGIADATRESYTLTLADPEPVLIRAWDDHGNAGTALIR